MANRTKKSNSGTCLDDVLSVMMSGLRITQVGTVVSRPVPAAGEILWEIFLLHVSKQCGRDENMLCF